MYNLYHFSLCPQSRLVRTLLSEKQLIFKLIEVKPWENMDEIANLNPAIELPILTVERHSILSVYAIFEYLEAIDEEFPLLSSSHFTNAEIRRLFDWFTRLFYKDVAKPLLDERLITHYITNEPPRTNVLRMIKNNLLYHLDYVEHLLHVRKWIASDSLSVADFAAATQISVVDYLGDMDWSKHPLTKEWYSILKSRPSFRPILNDRVVGFIPPAHYQILDF